MVENEIYTGAGLSATMIPEIDLELSELVGTVVNSVNTLITTYADDNTSLTWTADTNTRLVPSIYKGCVAQLTEAHATTGALESTIINLVIKDNAENKITFNQALTTGKAWKVVILGYGAPCPAPSETTITGSGATIVSFVNGNKIKKSASHTASIAASNGVGSGGTSTYTLTTAETTITCVDDAGTNYDTKNFTLFTNTDGTERKYTFRFIVGGQANTTTVTGTTAYIDMNDIDDSELAGTVAQKVAVWISSVTGLTATSDGADVTVTNDDGGYVSTPLKNTGSPVTITRINQGGEIATATIVNAGSGYTATPTARTITAESGGTNGSIVYGYGTETSTNLLADNWLGLVNTVTPPSVDAEMKQLNMALGGTRNFNYQYKGAETVGNASFDVSMNNGSWLYYALGTMTYSANALASGTHLDTTLVNDMTYAHKDSHVAGKNIYRVINGQEYPPIPSGENKAHYHKVQSHVVYNFKENDTGGLPSFALEVTAEKGNIVYGTQDDTSDYRRHFTKIYTGLQVNTFTLSFEEGMEVKATVDAVCRKAHDAEENYIPKRNVTTPSDLYNHKVTGLTTALTAEDTKPFMFSDGSIKAFGQTLGRVKSGTLTITNNLTPQRYIGNYDRTITSAHTAGQRQYELSLNLMITDKVLWTELRGQNEYSATNESIELSFEKDGVTNDSFTIKLDDYMLTTMDIPFPEDKGPLEVAITAQARNLNTCTYTGKWIIQG